jgi:hypothetical protein
MYKALMLPEAKEDIIKTAHWYNDKQTGLGKRFTNEVRLKISFILTNPNAIAIRYDDTRCAVLDTFPFMIHFNIDSKQKIIVISAVYHTSLNPDFWKKR